MGLRTRLQFRFYLSKSLRKKNGQVICQYNCQQTTYNAELDCALTSDIFYQSMVNFIERCWTVYSENNPAHVSPAVVVHMSILVLIQATFTASMSNFITGT